MHAISRPMVSLPFPFLSLPLPGRSRGSPLLKQGRRQVRAVQETLKPFVALSLSSSAPPTRLPLPVPPPWRESLSPAGRRHPAIRQPLRLWPPSPPPCLPYGRSWL